MTVSETSSNQAPTLNQSKDLKEDAALESHGPDAGVIEPKLKVETGDEWQRLSLISILYFTIRNFTNSAQVLIYTIPALVI